MPKQVDLDRINFLSNERLEQRLKSTTAKDYKPGDRPNAWEE
jgi:hypothetical protein